MFQSVFKKSTLFAPLALIILCTLIMMFNLNPLLQFDRVAIDEGQIYRLLSGNFSHSNGAHLLMNMAGVGALWILHGHFFTIRGYWLAVVSISVGCTGLIYFFANNIDIYVGLSGTLHGLLVYGALRDIRSSEKTGYLLLLGVLLKVAYEQFIGASTDLETLIASRVAIEAHLFGVIGGVALAALHWLKTSIARR
ncbi:rhombosortase [Pseudoalteromonas sp. T1lg48]|uniref:rhombosortase n=1 Tax=Pseudoalteromonas sp. T1lg48 TaxID=2077100 RepID=UPI000CF60598|nr:rhombosortase [Pseudoalteromonas sp. T1lg48]